MRQRFTDRAKMAMGLANRDALRLGHAEITARHVLLGILQEGGGAGVAAIKRCGVDVAELYRQTEASLGKGPDAQNSVKKLPVEPSVTRVVENAISMARTLNHDYVGTEHFVLALAKDESVRAIFSDAQLTYERIFEDVRAGERH